MARKVLNTAEEICKAKGYTKEVEQGLAHPAAVGILSAKINALFFWMDAAVYNQSVEAMRNLITTTFADILQPEEE